MKLNIPFVTKKKSTETGAQNADRFCDLVERLAAEQRVITMWPHPGWHGNNSEGRYGWTWMANEDWRHRVMNCLAERRVSLKSAEFHAPDSIDGWSFIAVSCSPLPRVATLHLEDTL